MHYYLTVEMCQEVLNSLSVEQFCLMSTYLTGCRTDNKRSIFCRGEVRFCRQYQALTHTVKKINLGENSYRNPQELYRRVVLVRSAFGDTLINPENAPLHPRLEGLKLLPVKASHEPSEFSIESIEISPLALDRLLTSTLSAGSSAGIFQNYRAFDLKFVRFVNGKVHKVKVSFSDLELPCMSSNFTHRLLTDSDYQDPEFKEFWRQYLIVLNQRIYRVDEAFNELQFN